MKLKRGSTTFLRGVIVLLGALVLAFYLIALPLAIRSGPTGGYLPILVGMYIPAIPFFIALYQGLLLLRYIDRNQAFSELSVSALKRIKYCAITISVAYTAGLPYIFVVADRDDAPGGILIGMLFAGAPLVIAVFAALLEKLLRNAIEIKSENDLTV